MTVVSEVPPPVDDGRDADARVASRFALRPVSAPGAEPAGMRMLYGGLLISTVGLCALLFVGYVSVFSGFEQQRAQHGLLDLFNTPAKAQLLSGRVPPEGSPVGVLDIPALGLSEVVVEGTSATDLLKGPGVMPGTAQPGSPGNAVIAGHRTIAGAVFAHLDTLRRGDRIRVVTSKGSYTYLVERSGTALPGHVDPTSPVRQPVLTLVTSRAGGPGRTFVRAKLLGTPGPVAVPRRPPALAQRGLAGDPDAVLPTALWGVL
ncbi:MAG: sortase, partial [Acidimicrobiales bacterium]